MKTKIKEGRREERKRKKEGNKRKEGKGTYFHYCTRKPNKRFGCSNSCVKPPECNSFECVSQMGDPSARLFLPLGTDMVFKRKN